MTERLRVMVVDDEALARRELKSMLKAVPGVEVVGEAANGIAALEGVRRLSPDLILLDIEMPGLNGVQVVEKLVEAGVDTRVIFVTAYDHYAIKAFEVNAVDYLLKPTAPERLAGAIERARRRAGGERTDLEGLVRTLRNAVGRRLSLRAEHTTYIIDEGELLYAYADGGSVVGVTEKLTGSLGYRSLDELGEALGARFIRTHRKFLVNMDSIREIIPYFGGSYRLRLRNGTEVPLSRRYAAGLRRILRF